MEFFIIHNCELLNYKWSIRKKKKKNIYNTLLQKGNVCWQAPTTIDSILEQPYKPSFGTFGQKKRDIKEFKKKKKGKAKV